MKDPPMSYAVKKRILLSTLSALLAVAVIVSTPFVVNVFAPFIGVETVNHEDVVDPTPDPTPEPDPTPTPDPEPDYNIGATAYATRSEILLSEGYQTLLNKFSSGTEDPADPDPENDDPAEITVTEVSSFAEIDFASDTFYRFTSDADTTVSADFYVEEMVCSLDGNGLSVAISGDNTLFGTIKGTLKNIRFTAEGTWTKTSDFAFIATTNNGVLEGVDLSVTGTMTIQGQEDRSATSIAGLVKQNTALSNTTGILSGCNATYSLTITGERLANAAFAGICAQNNYIVRDCVTSGTLTSTDCDLAGICGENAYLLYRNKNTAEIRQTTNLEQWSPLCAGVVLKNAAGYYNSTVRECENDGVVYAESTFSQENWAESRSFYTVESAGIVAANEGGALVGNKNNGAVTAKAVECVCYAGGVCALSKQSNSGFNTPSLSDNVNAGVINAVCSKITSLAGGVAAYCSGTTIKNSENALTGTVTVTVADCTYPDAYVALGGVVGNGSGCSFTSCVNYAEVKFLGKIQYAYVGGLVAISGSVSDGKNDGTVTVSGEIDDIYLGGVVSCGNGNMQHLQSSGNVTTNGGKTVHFGGLVGYTAYAVSEGYSTGTHSVAGDKAYVGGIVGYCGMEETLYFGRTYVYSGTVKDAISDCAITVTVTDSSYAGGIAGWVESRVYGEGTEEQIFGGGVTGAYSVGTITAGENTSVGGIVGGTDKRLVLVDNASSHFADNVFWEQDATAIAYLAE